MTLCYLKYSILCVTRLSKWQYKLMITKYFCKFVVETQMQICGLLSTMKKNHSIATRKPPTISASSFNGVYKFLLNFFYIKNKIKNSLVVALKIRKTLDRQIKFIYILRKLKSKFYCSEDLIISKCTLSKK